MLWAVESPRRKMADIRGESSGKEREKRKKAGRGSCVSFFSTREEAAHAHSPGNKTSECGGNQEHTDQKIITPSLELIPASLLSRRRISPLVVLYRHERLSV